MQVVPVEIVIGVNGEIAIAYADPRMDFISKLALDCESGDLKGIFASGFEIDFGIVNAFVLESMRKNTRVLIVRKISDTGIFAHEIRVEARGRCAV